jgi:hypothetical protein
MASVAEMKTLRREMKDGEPSVKDLGKFNPDDFDAHEDAFRNLLAQSIVLHCLLGYCTRCILQQQGRAHVSVPFRGRLLQSQQPGRLPQAESISHQFPGLGLD